MTDNDIVKALECCKKPVPDCDCCPIERGDMCFDFLKEVALDLINRQKAEIERLKDMVSQNEGVLPEYEKFIKAEAIKEFAERLKESAIDADVYSGYRKELFEKAVTVIEIDRILEEMTEEI